MQKTWTSRIRRVAALAVAACLLLALSSARAQKASLQDLAKAAVSPPEHESQLTSVAEERWE